PACGLFDAADVPPGAAEGVIGALAAAIVPAVERFLDEGLAPFVQAWRRFDALEGEEVALVDGERILVAGRSLGIDDSGGLRVRSGGAGRAVRGGAVALRGRGALRASRAARRVRGLLALRVGAHLCACALAAGRLAPGIRGDREPRRVARPGAAARLRV